MNIYIKESFVISVYNVIHGKISKHFVLLGDIPKNILHAANTNPWTPKEIKLFRTYYGPKWRRILIPPKNDMFVGGDDFDDFDDLDIIMASDDANKIITNTNTKIEISDEIQTEYLNIQVFPEDTIYDLKYKIYIATKIPIYRHHLFYEDNNKIKTTYSLYLDNVKINTDIRLYTEQFNIENDKLAGLPIDKYVEQQSDDIIIYPRDNFINITEITNNQIYLADLNDLFFNQSELLKIISDNYQLNLIYYSVIIQYWPQLPRSLLIYAISNPDYINNNYNLLFPNYSDVLSKYTLETSIINNVYNSIDNTKYEISITKAKLLVEPKNHTNINIRNVFDLSRSSKKIPEILAKFKTSDNKIYIVEKSHNTSVSHQYGSSSTKELTHFINDIPNKISISFAILQENTLKSKFNILNIHYNGVYSISGHWGIMDKIGFSDVVKKLTKTVEPVISNINDMKFHSIILGDALQLPGIYSKIDSLNISSFWAHPLTSNGFKEIKNRLKVYESAGITMAKSIQQPGQYVFMFKKGVVNYGKIKSELNISKRLDTKSENYYEFMSNPELEYIWDYLFNGKLIKLYHKSTGVQIEILNVCKEEFNRIFKYITTLLNNMIYGKDKLVDGIIKEGELTIAKGKLRNLQDRDPKLFDLKSLDSTAPVYSVLCQGQRQPEMYSQNEINKTKYDKKSLVKFWNFTKNETAYYKCPSKKFPHLHFGINKHPLGYCLPCCKKTKAVDNSKSATINSKCLKDHKLVENEDISLSVNVRHILSYGKYIRVGRLSYIPPKLESELFYGTLPKLFSYRLIGVPQKSRTVERAGFFYAIASSLGYEPRKFVDEMIMVLDLLGPAYKNLATGKAVVFDSVDELKETIEISFMINTSGTFSAFGIGGKAYDFWKLIISDIVHLRFNVDIVEFIKTDESINFTTNAVTLSRIKNSKKLQLIILMSNDDGTYPIIGMNQRLFLKHTKGYGPARRSFSLVYPDDEPHKDTLVHTIKTMVLKSDNTNKCENIKKSLIDLDMMYKLCDKFDYHISHILINIRSLCYGILINIKNKFVYIPIPYSAYYLRDAVEGKSAPINLYGPRPIDKKYPAELLESVFKNFQTINNISVKLKSKLVFNNMVIGFTVVTDCNLYNNNELFYYHDPITLKESESYKWGSLPISVIPYKPIDIDEQIYMNKDIATSSTIQKSKMHLISYGIYDSYLYKMFVSEFVSLLKFDKNVKLRADIETIIKSNKNIGSKLNELLKDYPRDLYYIKKYMNLNSVFEFDNVRFRQLMNSKNPEADIIKIMKPHVVITSAEKIKKIVANSTISNIYTACSTRIKDQIQCSNNKLIITAANFKKFVKILSVDIKNPYRSFTFNFMISGIINELNFIPNSDEKIIFK